MLFILELTGHNSKVLVFDFTQLIKKEECPMRLKDYARNHNKRKEYIGQPDLLLIGIDVSKDKHDACVGRVGGVIRKKLEFKNSRAGFKFFEETVRQLLFQQKCRRVLIGMEPSGLYWYGLYERLRSCGFGVCLVHCLAVKNNRKTMQDGVSKTDRKDAYSVFDLLQQAKFFLPVERDRELSAAYRLMRRHMAIKKRISRLKNQLRGALHLSFPELNGEIKDLLQPTSLRFLQAYPTPASIIRNGRKRFVERWRPRRRCGQWRPAKFERIYGLAQESIGLKDPYRCDEFEIKSLAADLEDAMLKQRVYLDKAIELLRTREDFQGLVSELPRIGEATAAAILTAIGNIDEYTNSKQLVKLAGLDIRRHESGSSIRKRPRISHAGSAYLRHWLYHFALRLVAHDEHFKAYFQRCKQRSPGKGAGLRAMMAVCDKSLRIIFRILKYQEKYQPEKDKNIAEFYQRQQKAA